MVKSKSNLKMRLPWYS